MLIYQAERAIQIWTGKNPDTKLMKIAALEALQQVRLKNVYIGKTLCF